MKKRKSKFIALLIVVALVMGGTWYASEHMSTTTVYSNQNQAEEKAPEPSVDNKKLDEIRSREAIKKQQELIVMETYLNEEKERIEAEKEAAIAKFDAEIAEVEKNLEGVRAEKLSFQ